ncbi:MAG: CDP-alcohol phosphatidyltransferase family protein [Patescibacteria group bacterium]
MIESRFNFSRHHPVSLSYLKLWQPIANGLAKSKVHPNLVTVLGFVMFLIAAYFIYLGNFLIGGIITFLAVNFDVIDGMVARKQNRVSSFGAFFDSFLDRYSEFVIFLAIYLHYLDSLKDWQVIFIWLALIGSFLVSYVRARAEGIGIECNIGFFQRAPRFILLIIGLFLAHFWGLDAIVILMIIMAIFTHFTFIQRIIHLYRETKRAT